LKDRFHDGAVFVPLAQLGSIDELLPALAGALRVHLPPGGDLLQALLDRLAGQQLLLVLDNFEHLVDEAALICDILANGPQVKVLVTSREKLNLGAETLFHLGGLELPPPGDLRNVGQYDSLRLFLQKAAQARPGFSLNTDITPPVVRICQLVDGNPLGILMAAAWLEHFSPAEIAGEISDGLDFLSCHLRDAEPRHCCMRAVFDSSFERLDEHLRAVFPKLAAFRGGFDLPAARAVAGADLGTLMALVDKSLLARDADTGRYELHELLRQYAGERLAASSDHQGVLGAFVGYYLAFVRQRETRMISDSAPRALDEVQADFDNIRQAFARIIENRDLDSARAALPGLYAFCDMRSRFYEGEALFRMASEGLAPRTGERPEPPWGLALLSWFDMRGYIEGFDSWEGITSQAQSCLQQSRAMDDAQGTAACLVLLGTIAQRQADYKAAIRDYELAMLSYPPLDDVYWVNMRIGISRQALGDYPGAIEAFRISLQRGKDTGPVRRGWSLLNIGDTLLLQGEPAEAGRTLEQARSLFEAVGTTVGVLWSDYSLSQVALQLGDLGRARERAEAAGEHARRIHSASWIRKTDDLHHRIDPQVPAAQGATKDQGHEPFSPRELEVLQLLRSDLNGPAIAQRLVVSLNTVRYHTKNIYRKLGASTRLEALQRAKELGL
jgi:predicted ATPase/DNA-binding CsgD family transcriptional regulator